MDRALGGKTGRVHHSHHGTVDDNLFSSQKTFYLVEEVRHVGPGQRGLTHGLAPRESSTHPNKETSGPHLLQCCYCSSLGHGMT